MRERVVVAGLGVVIAILCAMTTGSAQVVRPLSEAKALRCIFTVQASGTWVTNTETKAELTERQLILRFTEMDTQDGVAEAEGSDGEISVRLAGDYLHILQTLSNGDLYTTTVFNRPSRPGRYRAVQARHQLADTPEPVRPVQLYGECEVS